MRKLDRRGVAALEFCFVGAPVLILMFVIFDFGRYALTVQSLRKLANDSARALMIQCYTPAKIGLTSTSPSTCTGDYLSDAEKRNSAPFLYGGTLSPTVTTTSGANALTVTATLPGFAMIMPVWPVALNATPSASTSVPF
ncbi:pilus assembly protein [Bradyrhizobium sp. KB893862 SZCCT0404]|uniref:TadE/TadG family type IV pilus assembly protein n=1 Tax=Bradyrhizobium sp. KB893862 SZCCT0404 TaxID=2807672 RepID=UPI001BA53E0D|nr:TadE family protein [Bradyrhizobium sp. KB893862 SZCCT0404]MBR1179809.1 pilus assembly protein [Bradyrhizobium sp. KB893862 SZCCT0404]